MSTQAQLENLIDIEYHYQVATYKKFPFVVERGEDVWVYTISGERCLDLYGGHGVVSTEHSHPRMVRTIRISRRSSYWLNRVIEWWMAGYAQISCANLLNAFSIQFE